MSIRLRYKPMLDISAQRPNSREEARYRNASGAEASAQMELTPSSMYHEATP